MTPADNQQTDATRPASRVGIIGGGQLGMLLCGAARDLGIHTIVLTDDATGPAVHTADELLVAPLDDQGAVSELIEKSEVITFELEAIPDVTLDSLRQAVDDAFATDRPTLIEVREQDAWLNG